MHKETSWLAWSRAETGELPHRVDLEALQQLEKTEWSYRQQDEVDPADRLSIQRDIAHTNACRASRTSRSETDVGSPAGPGFPADHDSSLPRSARDRCYFREYLALRIFPGQLLPSLTLSPSDRNIPESSSIHDFTPAPVLREGPGALCPGATIACPRRTRGSLNRKRDDFFWRCSLTILVAVECIVALRPSLGLPPVVH